MSLIRCNDFSSRSFRRKRQQASYYKNIVERRMDGLNCNQKRDYYSDACAIAFPDHSLWEVKARRFTWRQFICSFSWVIARSLGIFSPFQLHQLSNLLSSPYLSLARRRKPFDPFDYYCKCTNAHLCRIATFVLFCVGAHRNHNCFRRCEKLGRIFC